MKAGHIQSKQSCPRSADDGPSIACITRISGVAVIAIATLTLVGCALQPVQPWEKGDLAKPAMGFSADPLDDRFTQHIYNSKENASGGYGAGGGGCGCN